jgi:hypothetical protein
MSTKIKDYITGEYIDKKTAFSIVLEGYKRAIYFKSEEEYKNWLSNKELEEEIKKIMNKILGKSYLTALPPAFKKKLHIWKDSYTLKEIAWVLDKNMNEISKYRSKGVLYILAMIEGKLIQNHDTYINYSRINNKVNTELDDRLEKNINDNRFNLGKPDVRNFVR